MQALYIEAYNPGFLSYIGQQNVPSLVKDAFHLPQGSPRPIFHAGAFSSLLAHLYFPHWLSPCLLYPFFLQEVSSSDMATGTTFQCQFGVPAVGKAPISFLVFYVTQCSDS